MIEQETTAAENTQSHRHPGKSNLHQAASKSLFVMQEGALFRMRALKAAGRGVSQVIISGVNGGGPGEWFALTCRRESDRTWHKLF